MIKNISTLNSLENMFLSVSLKQLSLLGPVQYIQNVLTQEVETIQFSQSG